MRGVISAIGLAIVFVALNADAQSRPDFSGTWMPVRTTSGSACDGSFTITQDAATLRVALTAPSARPDVYNFDGSETRQTFDGRGAVTSPSRGSWTVNTMGSVTRAAWNGDQFVAVTHTAAKMVWPGKGRGEFDLENTFRRTFSLDASGHLVIEHLAILDPYPGGSTRRAELPNSWKCTYARSR